MLAMILLSSSAFGGKISLPRTGDRAPSPVSRVVLSSRSSAAVSGLPRTLGFPPPVARSLVVQPPPTDAEAGGPVADVAPVPDGGGAGAEALGHLLSGQQADGHGSSRGNGDGGRTE